MDWALLIYLSLVSQNILTVSGVFCILSAMSITFAAIPYFIETYGDYGDEVIAGIARKFIKICLPIFFISGVFAVFVPDQKTILAMIAADQVQEIAQSDQMKRVASKSLLLLEQYLESADVTRSE